MTSAAKNYAQATFMLASEEGILSQISNDFRLCIEALNESPEYIALLNMPNIPKSERTAMIETTFGGRVHEYVLSFLQLLCEQGYMEDIYNIIAEFEALKKASENTETAIVKSIIPLSDSQLDTLREKLEAKSGKTVIIKNETDPSLVGGLTVEMQGKMFDGSLKRQLADIKGVIGK